MYSPKIPAVPAKIMGIKLNSVKLDTYSDTKTGIKERIEKYIISLLSLTNSVKIGIIRRERYVYPVRYIAVDIKKISNMKKKRFDD